MGAKYQALLKMNGGPDCVHEIKEDCNLARDQYIYKRSFPIYLHVKIKVPNSS